MTDDKTTASPRSILIIDDDKFLTDMYAMKFTQSGYTVQACLSVHDGLESLRAGFQADVILFDITMPELDGFALLQKLRDDNIVPHALKIALSNQSSDTDMKHASDLGADKFVVKASTIPSEVVSIITDELARRKK